MTHGELQLQLGEGVAAAADDGGHLLFCLLFFVLWCRADLEHRVPPRQSGTAVRRPRFGSLTCDCPCRALLPQDGGCQRWLSCSFGVAEQPPAPSTTVRRPTLTLPGSQSGNACRSNPVPRNGGLRSRYDDWAASRRSFCRTVVPTKRLLVASGVWERGDASSAGLRACDLIATWVDFDGTQRTSAVRH